MLTVTVTNTAVGQYFADDFTRTNALIAPWIAQSGTWQATNGVLKGGPNALQSYAYAYITNTWSDYWIQAQIQFTNAGYGGGIGGRLNPASGAHYAAWVYPENSSGGSHVIKLVKFQTWTTWGYNGASYTPMQQVTLPSVSTNWHTVKLAFIGARIAVYFDGAQVISMTDAEATPYLTGAVSMDLWTDSTTYTMTADNVMVSSLTAPDAFTLNQGGSLTIPAPGVLTNDVGVFSTNLTATVVTGVSSGALNLNANGGFTYTPRSSFSGIDSFVYQASDGQTNLGMARVTLTVNSTNGVGGHVVSQNIPAATGDVSTPAIGNRPAKGAETTVPAPKILSVTISNDIATISWTAISGNTYRLQYQDAAVGTNWTDAKPDILATDSTASATDDIRNTPQRFYRILLVQ